MKKTILYAFFAIAIVFASCGSDDDITDNGTSIKPEDVKLIADKLYIEPFEQLHVKLDNTDEELETLWDVAWNNSGGGSVEIYSSDDLTKTKLIRKGKFYSATQPGKATVSVTSYDMEKVAHVKSVEYEVTNPRGNFFVVRWHNFEEGKVYGCLNDIEGVKGIRFHLMLATEYIDTKNRKDPYVHLKYSFHIGTGKEADEWKKKLTSKNRSEGKEIRDLTKNLYRECLIANYGESKLKYECEDGGISQTPLRPEYEKRFKYAIKDNDYPVEIWEAPYANIALIALGNDDLPIRMNSYYVIAEPR